MITPGAEHRCEPAGAQRPERTSPGGPSRDLLAEARGLPAGWGDATALYDGTGLPASPRLVVTAGPRRGFELALVNPVTTVGRGRNNTVTIPDVSLSRRHSRLEQHGDEWVVLDQGSGNGTRVNGRPVRRHRLRHGDEIAMGDTAIRFVEPGGVLVWTSLPGGRGRAATGRSSLLRHRTLLCVAVFVALAAVLGAALVRQRRLSLLAAARERGDADRALARARFQEGTALLKQRLWAEGRDKLRIAAELAPRDAEIARQLDSAETELPRAQALAAARAAVAREDPGAARESLAQIPADSALAEEARILERTLPPPADAAVQSPQIRRERTAHWPRGRSSLEASEARAILADYLGGNVAAALERAHAGRTPAADRLAASLERFMAAWREGVTQQDPAHALHSLEAAADSDRAIARGRAGRVEREVGRALATRHATIARGLSADDDLPAAAAHLRAAAQADPSNPEVQEQLRQVADRAREIYLRAYAFREDDPVQARQSFRLVGEILPQADETAEKARRWASSLEGKVAE
jgi:pSer/pThr/pTyr-binding forkhead associated (FHA) protein